MKVKQTSVCCLLPAILLFAGCREAAPVPPGKVEVTFSVLESDTRTTDTSGEREVDNWILLLFREGKLTDYGTSASEAPIRRSLETGDYTAFAVVNPPASFRPDLFTDLPDLLATPSDLRENSPGRLLMAGNRTLTIPVADGLPVAIGVDRLVCKTVIRKISTAFTDPVLASRTFVLKAVYLTNCYGRSRLGSDLAESETDAGPSCWYNRMGFHSDAGVDALLAEREINLTISEGAPCLQPYTLYGYPNPTVADSRSGEWSKRHTRLVIEAEIDGRTYYYPVTLPVLQRNNPCVIEEAVIRKLGSKDPEKDEPGSLEITFGTSVDGWDPEYFVHENS